MSDLTILLVEDNPDDELLTLRAFERSGIANPIVVVRDGVEALDYLFHRGAHADRPPGTPLLILLDLKMPRLDGLETLREIRAAPATHKTLVLVLTSSRDDSDVERAYELGANGYVQKHVEFEAFCRVTRAIGTYWLLTNLPPPERR